MTHYALKTDYENYTSTDTADLPAEINRKLDRAEELVEQIIRNNGQAEIENLDADASDGQSDISVLDASVFDSGEDVTVLDDNNSETGTIDSINEEGSGSDTITLTSNLTNSYAVADRAHIKTTNPDDWYLRQREALRDATCAQVEYWEEAVGENYDMSGSVESFAIGNLRMSYGDGSGGGGSILAPRAYRLLQSYGLIYAGIGQKSSTVQDFIAGDPRVD